MNALARGRRLPVLIGAVLLGAAVWSIASNRDIATAAWSSLREPSPIWAALLPGCVLASFAVTALGLQWLTNRVVPVGRIPFAEMLALTLTSALGNMVPLQAGLVGRVAYQQRVHGVPATVGVLLAVQSTLLTLAAAAWIGVTLLFVRVGGFSWLAVPATVLLPIAIAMAPQVRGRAFRAAFAARLVEVMLSAVRTAAAFCLVGSPIDPVAAMVFALAAQLANAVPMVGNGLGVREWAVALLAPSVAGLATPEALAAELVHRAAEILIVVPGGLFGMIPLARRAGMAARTRRVDPTTREPVTEVSGK